MNTRNSQPPLPSTEAACSFRLETLKKRADFLAAARAKRFVTGTMVVQARRRPAHGGAGQGTAGQGRAGRAVTRVGFTCSKKVGNSVARNRAKRRLRELARHCLPDYGKPGWDYVLIGRAERTVSEPFATLTSDFTRALTKLHAREDSLRIRTVQRCSTRGQSDIS